MTTTNLECPVFLGFGKKIIKDVNDVSHARFVNLLILATVLTSGWDDLVNNRCADFFYKVPQHTLTIYFCLLEPILLIRFTIAQA